MTREEELRAAITEALDATDVVPAKHLDGVVEQVAQRVEKLLQAWAYQDMDD